MKHIPIRSIHQPRNEPAFPEKFRIRDLQHLLAGKRMIQELHRHDFFYILAVQIETHITQKKQVSQYADLLHLSPYQLNAITKATLGKTCSTLINEQIILESKRHLLATSSQVNQVADHLGFEDVSYFIRFFKKHTGYSPDAFRQHFR